MQRCAHHEAILFVPTGYGQPAQLGAGAVVQPGDGAELERLNRPQEATGAAGVVVGVVVQHHAIVVDAVRVVRRHVNFRLFARCNARVPPYGLPLAVFSLPVQRPRPFEFPFVSDGHRGRFAAAAN